MRRKITPSQVKKNRETVGKMVDTVKNVAMAPVKAYYKGTNKLADTMIKTFPKLGSKSPSSGRRRGR